MGNNELAENRDFREKVGKWVDELVEINRNDKASKNKIVGLLQKINEEILNHKITADQYTIYPIWVEAYYYKKDKKDVFDDMSCHINNPEDIKGNVPDQFEFRKHTIGRGGVDLYLGKSDNYYLSFLIKLALIQKDNENSELCPQRKIVKKIGSYLELRKYLEPRLNDVKQEVNLDEYINEAKSKKDLEKYLNCNSVRDGLKRYLLDVVSPKLIFSPTNLDLDKNNLKVAKCKRVGLSGGEDDDYVNYELAAFYEIEERVNNPRSYNTLKGKTDLYVLKKD